MFEIVLILALASASASRFWPRLTSLAVTDLMARICYISDLRDSLHSVV